MTYLHLFLYQELFTAVYPNYGVLGWYSVGEEVCTFLPLNVLYEFNSSWKKSLYMMVDLLRGWFYSQTNATVQSEPTFFAYEPEGSGRI